MRKNAIFVLLLLFAILVTAPASAATIYWNGQTGIPGNDNWAVAANWQGNKVPGTSDYAYINDGGTAFITGTQAVGRIYMASTAGTSGHLLLTAPGTTMTIGTGLNIGQNGVSTVKIANGAKLFGNSNVITLGGSYDGEGYLDISGHGSEIVTRDIVVGSNGFGQIDITGGATLNQVGSGRFFSIGKSASGSNRPEGDGVVNLSGAGSAIIMEANLYVGEGGTGTLNVTNGATVTAATLVVGSQTEGYGTLNISGKGSTVTISDYVLTGTGKGIYNIRDGGTLELTGVSGLELTNFAYSYPLPVAVVNVINGTLTAPSIRTNRTSQASTAMLNVLGSGSDITLTENFNYDGGTAYSAMSTNFGIDSSNAGVSTVNMTNPGGTIDLKGSHVVTAMGFALQNTTNTFDLFSATDSSNYTGTFAFSTADTPHLQAVAASSPGKYTIGFNDTNMVEWDIAEDLVFTNTANAADTWIKIVNTTDLSMMVRFQFDQAPTSELLQTFVDYLNHGVYGVGSSFNIAKLEDNIVSLMLPNNDMLGGQYDVVGWGLSTFNMLNTLTGDGNNVSLLDITLMPEPSTWVMLLLGAGLLLTRVRRKLYQPQA